MLNPEAVEKVIVDKSSCIVADMVTGTIYYASVKVEQMLGYWMAGALIGMQVEDLLPATSRTQHLEYRKMYAKDPRPRSMTGRTLKARMKDGQEIQLAISLDPIVIGGEPCVVLTIVKNE